MDKVEKVPSDTTVELIFSNLPKINKDLPLKDEDVDEILEYFECMESSLSNSDAIGEMIDRELLNHISDCIDEIAIYEDWEYLDLEKLNYRLKILSDKEIS